MNEIPDRRDLRDARLQRALEHAPDAHMQPDRAVRQAILKAAHEAAQVTAAPSVAGAGTPGPAWWSWGSRRSRSGAGGRRMPWNAAFATVLIAGFVAVLWQGQEVPDARLDTAASGVTKPAAPAPAVAPEKPQAPRAGRDRQHERERELREDHKTRKAIARQERAADVPSAVVQEQAAGTSAAPAVPAAAVAPPAPTAKAAPAGPDAPAAMADAAASRQAPSVAAAPAALGELRARAAAPAPAAVAASPPPTAALPDWTALRVVEGARALPTTRGDAGALPSLLQALAGSAVGPRQAGPAGASAGAASASEAFAPARPLRMELMQGSDVLGVLEITGTQWRFTPAGGSPVQTGRADAQTLQALRAELQRLGLLP